MKSIVRTHKKTAKAIMYNNEYKLAADTVNIQDHILLRRAIHDKDREALACLYTKYYRRITRFTASYIDSVTDAEDLAQNVFLELCQGNGHYDGQRDAEAYLFGVARNLVSHYRRHIRKYPQTAQPKRIGWRIARHDEYQPAPISLTQLKKLLEDAAEQLPPKAKEAIWARVVERLSVKEAAQKCGCSTDAFYKRFDAALKTLETMKKTRSLMADDAVNP